MTRKFLAVLFPLLFWPLTLLYGWVVKWRTYAYLNGWKPRTRLPGKVISIGNLEVGGTGKTPLVLAVAKFLKQHGYNPVILTRGYKSGLRSMDSMVLLGPRMILPPERRGEYYADEAKMQAVRLKEVPVVVGADRSRAAMRYLDYYKAPTHWILDDGFQHLRIERDLDLLLLDAVTPFGSNQKLLPAGRLREPIEHARRADAIVFTRASKSHPRPDIVDLVKRWNIPSLGVPFKEDKPQFVYGPTTNFAEIEKVALVTAVARPERLEERLRQLNVKVTGKLIKADHRRFRARDIAHLSESADGIVTTAKDYWREPKAFHKHEKPVFLLPLKAEISEITMRELLEPVL